MATDSELRDLFGDGAIRKRIEVAMIIVAQEILSAGDTAAPYSQDAGAHILRAKWAWLAFTSLSRQAEYLHFYVLAANANLTVEQINSASEAAIQSNIRNAVDEIAAAIYGA